MDRRVLYFIFQNLDMVPPCIAQICTLRDMGIEVAVLTCGCGAPARKLLAEKGVALEVFQQPKNRLLRIAKTYLCSGGIIHRFLRRYWTDNSVAWIGSELIVVKLWPFFRNIHPIVINALEFYETRLYQTQMRRIAPRADILTACEPHRAQYMVDWWGLKKPPYILRNKPYGQLPPKGSGSTPALRAAIAQIRDKKVLLYQGGIGTDRDLSLLARALQQGKSDYYLVLTGVVYSQHCLDNLLQIYDKTIYLGYFPAPSHLEITPYAAVAVTYNKDNCINTRYCAPNKIHEYAGYGIPMLCNRLPGLTLTVGAAGAAECVDFGDPDAVNDALERINRHYDAYRRAALAFYDSVDNTQTMEQIVQDAFSGTRAESQ